MKLLPLKSSSTRSIHQDILEGNSPDKELFESPNVLNLDNRGVQKNRLTEKQNRLKKTGPVYIKTGF